VGNFHAPAALPPRRKPRWSGRFGKGKSLFPLPAIEQIIAAGDGALSYAMDQTRDAVTLWGKREQNITVKSCRLDLLD
jgi:hypothetical protein